MPLKAADIRRLFELLDEELRKSDTRAELFLAGGAVMCLAYAARPSTQGIDAVFRPPVQVRQAAARVAARAGANPHWLNDGVKGFMSARGDFAPFLELDHLRVMVAQPEYLLAMKCLSMRLGAEFHDEDDIRYLLRHLDIRSLEQAMATVTKYYARERFPQKTLYALEELLPGT
jgi:predicted ABC-class ATPase